MITGQSKYCNSPYLVIILYKQPTASTRTLRSARQPVVVPETKSRTTRQSVKNKGILYCGI